LGRIKSELRSWRLRIGHRSLRTPGESTLAPRYSNATDQRLFGDGKCPLKVKEHNVKIREQVGSILMKNQAHSKKGLALRTNGQFRTCPRLCIVQRIRGGQTRHNYASAAEKSFPK
jgi:hypothetical protein